MFNQDLYQELFEVKPSLAESYLSKHPKEKEQPEKFQLWPLKYNWWHHKQFDPVKKQYKFLEPALIEIGNLKHIHSHNESCKFLSGQPIDFVMKHIIIVNTHQRTPVFMKFNCKAAIAARIGCSVRSLEVYLRSFVRLGILKSHNLGNAMRLYSVGYWAPYKDKDKIQRHKVNPYMNQKVGKLLVNFYLRKPKK